MFRRYRFVLAALVGALLMPLSVAPVFAQQPAPPAPSSSGTGTFAQIEAQFAALPPPTAHQIALAQAYLDAHPLQVTIEKLPAPTSTTPKLGLTPYASIGVYWWGYRLHLTPTDVHDIWYAVLMGGLAGAGAVICSPSGVGIVFCGVIGGVAGLIIASLVWNYFGYYVPSCGVHIDYRWWGTYSYGTC